jgi:hypothetical protein
VEAIEIGKLLASLGVGGVLGVVCWVQRKDIQALVDKNDALQKQNADLQTAWREREREAANELTAALRNFKTQSRN